MYYYDIKACEGQSIVLGRLGENLWERVIFDVSGYIDKLPDASVTLINRLPKGTDAYPVANAELDGMRFIWTITNTELTQTGIGECELIITSGERIAKSIIWQTYVSTSLDGSGEAPEPWESWQTVFAQLKEDAERAAAEAAESAADAESAAQGAEQAETDAESAADTASTKASEASASATDAAAAKNAAETAQTAAETAQRAAETAADEAESFADDAQEAKEAAETLMIFPATGGDSADVATITDAANDQPMALKVNILPAQAGSGTPAPDNIRAIIGWTGANITVAGANQNIWDEEWENGTFNVTTGENITLSNQIRSKNLIPIRGGVSFYFKTGGVAAWCILYNADGTVMQTPSISGTRDTAGNSFTIKDEAVTLPEGAAYVRFYMIAAYGATYQNDISINYPATDTAYHAEHAKTYEVNFPTEAGTVYGGTLEIAQDGSGTLTVDTAYIELTGAYDWGGAGNTGYDGEVGTNRYIGFASNNLPVPLLIDSGLGQNGKAIRACDRLRVQLGPIWANDTNNNVINFNAQTQVHLRLANATIGVESTADGATRTAAFKAWLNENPVHVAYRIATPQIYTFTAAQITSLFGTNNVWADCGNTQITAYYADKTLLITAAEQRIEDLTVSAETLSAGSQATVTKLVDPDTGAVTLVFGIPQGQTGQTGETGATGNGIASITLNPDYTLTINYTNGQHYTTTSIRGATGATGADGTDGTDAYVYIRYSATEPTQDSDMKTTPDAWMGIYSGDAETAPTAYTAYTWYKIKGETGASGGVTDVQVNGRSVVTDGVANVPKATTSLIGVVRPHTNTFTFDTDGRLVIQAAGFSHMKEGTNSWRPIMSNGEQAAAFFGLAKAAGDTTQSASSNAVGTYTNEAKKAIQRMLGVESIWTRVAEKTVTEAATDVRLLLSKPCRHIFIDVQIEPTSATTSLAIGLYNENSSRFLYGTWGGMFSTTAKRGLFEFDILDGGFGGSIILNYNLDNASSQTRRRIDIASTTVVGDYVYEVNIGRYSGEALIEPGSKIIIWGK